MVLFRLRMTYKQLFSYGSIYFFCVLTVLLDRWLVITPLNMDHTIGLRGHLPVLFLILYYNCRIKWVM
jgi:hypothetical protein